MNYLTSYYKNLCEQLQEQIDILEGRYKKAMRAGHKYPELLHNALAVYDLKAKNARESQRDADATLQTAEGELESEEQSGEKLRSSLSGPHSSESPITPMLIKDQSAREARKSEARKKAEGASDKAFVRRSNLDLVRDSIIDKIEKLEQSAQSENTNQNKPFQTPETMHVTPSHY
jgi:hypothetical protein